MKSSVRALAAAVTAAVVLLAACGDDQTAAPELSPVAEQGRQVAAQNGCASCHGANGQGGVAPAFVGLVGSEQTFTDGTSIIVDEAYVRESIVEPAARQVAGYSIMMPQNDLSPDEVDQVVAYILELSTPTEPAS